MKEWSDLWEAMKATPTEWIETTEGMYWTSLEAVPPRAGGLGRFLVGEPYTHNENGQAVYACFKSEGGKYFARYMTLQEFREAA